MDKLSQKEQIIISILIKNGMMQSSAISGEFNKTGGAVSLVTIKRALTEMAEKKLVAVSGSGRSTGYAITALGRLISDIDAKAYCNVEPDKRYGLSSYNFDLFPAIPTEIFNNNELAVMDLAAADYEQRTSKISETIRKKELERFIIELSWKSSKIEGNTYTLLDTEKLILENKEAPGHDKNETLMIINHKEALNFVLANTGEFKTLTRANLEKLHEVLVKDMDVALELRKDAVGIAGSKYRPLGTAYQIQEAIALLSDAIERAGSPYAKALLAVLGISYIQPFEDGNKRTARLMANAFLFAHQKTPLSYRSVDEEEYREAVIVFYELNSLTPFKKIFIAQFDFAARNYALR
ncbi:MAG TPA: Fic family protein [Candidatus Paceibacterota bacterium]|nr:Fic family protein [Candidatus Pacearchaeota archaeon]HRZ51242.1 Fic family protein [Candidatus Paceibacterota bacterium]HSA36964.1 Fic family protein [Candidatus Paceibacterota bacterium]